MADDFFKSIKAALYDRTTSPLLGAFTLSWAIGNHRLFFVLFSQMPVATKFPYIDETLYDGWLLKLVWLLVGPLLTSLAFLYLYPYPARRVYEFCRQRQKELKEIRQKIEDETLLSTEESRRIRRQLVDVRAGYEMELKQAADEIDQLKEGLVGAQEREAGLAAELASHKDKLAKVEESESLLRKKLEFVEVVNEAARKSERVSDRGIEAQILSGPHRLVYNPKDGRHKTMTFKKGGEIAEGKNDNESSWQIKNSRLELLQADGRVHSRFAYEPDSKRFPILTSRIHIRSVINTFSQRNERQAIVFDAKQATPFPLDISPEASTQSNLAVLRRPHLHDLAAAPDKRDLDPSQCAAGCETFREPQSAFR